MTRFNALSSYVRIYDQCMTWVRQTEREREKKNTNPIWLYVITETWMLICVNVCAIWKIALYHVRISHHKCYQAIFFYICTSMRKEKQHSHNNKTIIDCVIIIFILLSLIRYNMRAVCVRALWHWQTFYTSL